MLRAKLLVQVLTTAVPTVVCCVCAVLVLRPALPLALLCVVMPLLFVWLSAEFCLLLDLKRSNLVWTNEITVIKQRLTVLLAMMAGWVYAAVVGALYLFVGAQLGAVWYLLAWSVLTAALALALRGWLRRGGCRAFEAL